MTFSGAGWPRVVAGGLGSRGRGRISRTLAPPAGSAAAATALADDGAKRVEHRLVLLETEPYLLLGDPRIGVKTPGLVFQLDLGLRLGDAVGDPGQDLRVAGPQALDAFGAQPGMRRRHDPIVCRRGRRHEGCLLDRR